MSGFEIILEIELLLILLSSGTRRKSTAVERKGFVLFL
jgi:hypothetical protein